MTPNELRNSVLQLAVQGRLVEQRPEEGSAKDLLKNIQIAENVDGQRVKQKVIAKITEDEKPFEIPDNWEWIKLGSVCTIARGGSPRPIKNYLTTSEDGINWIKIGDTEKNGKYICSTAEKIIPEGVSKSRRVYAGDFLLTNSMSFGRPYILKIDGCIHDGWLVISQSSEIFNQDFLYWLLSSAHAYSQFCGKVGGSVVKNLNSDKVANSVFPLPPLSEQKRIVSRLEALLPYIDRYGEAWNRLEECNERFPVDLQKSLLQLAIQGRLVEQRHEEGTGEELYHEILAEKSRLIKEGKIKKEKALPEIKDDEIPFEIPESWKWVRLGSLLQVISGVSYKKGDVQKGGIRVLRGGNIQNMQVLLEEDDVFLPTSYNDEIKQVRYGDILIVASTGSKTVIGKAGFVDRDIPNTMIGAFLRICRPHFDFLVPFLKYLFESDFYRKHIRNLAQGTNINNVNESYITEFVIPLPPLAEQKRIVAKLEELLPLCERLTQNNS